MLVLVGAEALLVGRVDPVSVDVALLDWEIVPDVGVVTEAGEIVVVAELDVLVVVAVVTPLSDVWDGSGQLNMDVPPGSGGGVLVQVLMLTTLLTSDI